MTGKFLTCAWVLFSRGKYGFIFRSVPKYLGSQKKSYSVKLFREKASICQKKTGKSLDFQFGEHLSTMFLTQFCALYSYCWTTLSFYTKWNQSKWEDFTQKWCESGRNRQSSNTLGGSYMIFKVLSKNTFFDSTVLHSGSTFLLLLLTCHTWQSAGPM